MELRGREEIEAPIEWVWDRVVDFDAHERTALRRGARVERLNASDGVAPGVTWRIDYEFRGRQRDTELRLVEVNRPNRLHLASETGGVAGDVVVALTALSPSRTLLEVAVELTPSTIPARLLVQSLRLAKGQIDRRLEERLKGWADDLARRYAAPGVA